ncbi:hypothetical protein OHB54_01960 [Streptomyces sp. NBC_01007]|nr:hypothetical protein OHB54_01960 [Streptomyces sp. NBC_01007]
MAGTPQRLQFRLRYFIERDSTDSGAQGASDEVFMSATGLDSSSVTIGPDRKPVVNLIHAPRIGDVSNNAIRGSWKNHPYVLIDFDLQQPGDFPRTYTVTLFFVEKDNGDLAEDFQKLEEQVGSQIEAAVETAVASAAAEAVGAAIGSAVPGVGTVVGLAVGALAEAAWDGLVDLIHEGLADDIFTPVPVILTVPDRASIAGQAGVGSQQSLRIKEHGADYELFYDWNVVEGPAMGAGPSEASQTIQALSAVGVDFSVPESSLRGWLSNPEFTPYPAISQALLQWGRQLKEPVYLDVVVWNYEHTPGVSSPRSVADVKPDVLKAAVLAASNSRYGTQETDVERLLK